MNMLRTDRPLRHLTLWITLVGAATFTWLIWLRISGHYADPFTHMSDVLNGAFATGAYTLVPIVGYSLWGRQIAARFGGFRSQIGRSIHLLGLGAISWGIGNTIWMYFQTCNHLPGMVSCGSRPLDPFPSVADVFYLALLPLMGASLVSMAQMMNLSRRDWRLLGAFMVAALLVTGYVGLPTVHIGSFAYGKGYFIASGVGPVALLVGVGYVLADVVLMSIALVILMHARRLAGGAFLTPIIAMTATIGTLYVGDFLFQYRSALGLSLNADASDLTFWAFQMMTMVTVLLFGRVDWKMRRAFDADVEAQLAEERAAGVARGRSPRLANP